MRIGATGMEVVESHEVQAWKFLPDGQLRR